MIPPVLETERLTLRPFQPEDLDGQAAALADPDVMRHLGGRVEAREDVWRRMLAALGTWSMLGYGYWAVRRRSDGVYLGNLGFADFRRDMRPSIEGLPEMGWLLAAHAHGQGYAAEGVAAALAWADRALDAPQIVAIIDPGNLPSIRLAERAGFSVQEGAVYRDAPILLLRRIRV